MITISFKDHEKLGLDPRPIKDKVKGGFVHIKTNIGLQTFLRWRSVSGSSSAFWGPAMSLVGSTSGFSFLFIPMLSATGSSLKNSVCSKCTDEGSKSGLCCLTKFTHFWYNFGFFLGSCAWINLLYTGHWCNLSLLGNQQHNIYLLFLLLSVLRFWWRHCYTDKEGVLKVGPIYDVTRSKKRRGKFRKNRSNSCNFG